jgi:branched-chain amino acid aminotransferase
MNGDLVDWDKATVHVGAHALHYGSGVFEGIRAYHTPDGTAVFRLRDHLERLANSARIYRMEIPFTLEELEAAVWQTIKANGLDSCYIRPIVYRGLGQLGVYPLTCPVDTAIMTWSWGAYLGDEALAHGIKATISPIRRFADDMMPNAAKATGQYLNSMLAKLDASERGFEEAILTNAEGNVSEGSGENLFAVFDGTLTTPRLTDSILPGVTRFTVLEIANELGIPTAERSFTVDELIGAEEIFVTGTAAEITPVRSVDEHTIGEPGPVTRQVQDAFFATIRGESTPWSHYMERPS